MLSLIEQNAVEEYVYEMRGKIYDDLEKYINENEREAFSKLLDDTENWLYEDGEDCSKQTYLDKSAELKVKNLNVCFALIQFSLPRVGL